MTLEQLLYQQSLEQAEIQRGIDALQQLRKDVAATLRVAEVTPTNAPSRARVGAVPTMDDIKPGASDEELDRVLRYAHELLRQENS